MPQFESISSKTEDTFMGASFAENLAKKLLPVCFFADKVVGNIYQI